MMVKYLHAMLEMDQSHTESCDLQDEAAEVLKEAEDTTEGLKTQVSNKH